MQAAKIFQLVQKFSNLYIYTTVTFLQGCSIRIQLNTPCLIGHLPKSVEWVQIGKWQFRP